MQAIVVILRYWVTKWLKMYFKNISGKNSSDLGSGNQSKKETATSNLIINVDFRIWRSDKTTVRGDDEHRHFNITAAALLPWAAAATSVMLLLLLSSQRFCLLELRLPWCAVGINVRVFKAGVMWDRRHGYKDGSVIPRRDENTELLLMSRTGPFWSAEPSTHTGDSLFSCCCRCCSITTQKSIEDGMCGSHFPPRTKPLWWSTLLLLCNISLQKMILNFLLLRPLILYTQGLIKQS